jgi:hypothetical protein
MFTGRGLDSAIYRKSFNHETTDRVMRTGRIFIISWTNEGLRRFQWPCVLRRGFATARLLRFWLRMPPGHGCLSVVSVDR